MARNFKRLQLPSEILGKERNKIGEACRNKLCERNRLYRKQGQPGDGLPACLVNYSTIRISNMIEMEISVPKHHFRQKYL